MHTASAGACTAARVVCQQAGAGMHVLRVLCLAATLPCLAAFLAVSQAERHPHAHAAAVTHMLGGRLQGVG